MRKKERRTYIRLSAYHLVKYKALSVAGEQKVPVLATLRDISAGGVCLRTQEPLPLSSLLELKIQFPKIKTPIFTLVKVIWARRIKGTENYEVGTQFVEIEDSMRKIIDEQIKLVHEQTKREGEAG